MDLSKYKPNRDFLLYKTDNGAIVDGDQQRYGIGRLRHGLSAGKLLQHAIIRG